MPKAAIYMVFATIFYVLAHSSVKSLNGLPLHETVFVRIIISFMICLAYIQYKRINVMKDMTKAIMLRGLFGICGMVSYFYTLTIMPLATAMTINYLSPMFTLAFASIVLKERSHPRVWYFFALAFVGVLLTKGFDNSVGWFDFSVAIAGAIFSGLAYTFVRKAGKTSDPMLIIFALPLIGLGPSLGSFLVFEFVPPGIGDIALLIVMSLLVFLAQYCTTMAYTLGAIAQVSILNYLALVWSVLMGYFVFNENLTFTRSIGLCFIVGALMLNEFFSLRDKKLKAKLTMSRPQSLSNK